MILGRIIFYKLAEMALDAFFDSVSNNFNRVNLDGGSVIYFDDLKVGDSFTRMSILKYGEYFITFYDVKILKDPAPVSNIKSFKCNYFFRECKYQIDGVSGDYISASVMLDSMKSYMPLVEDNGIEEIYDDWITIAKDKFRKWWPNIANI